MTAHGGALTAALALIVSTAAASRVPEGRVMGSSQSLERGVLAAGDLPPHKARVLLMLALLTTTDAHDIQRLLDSH